MCTIHLFIKVILGMPFYHYQHHFLIYNDIRATCFSLSILYILIMQLILWHAHPSESPLFITRSSISFPIAPFLCERTFTDPPILKYDIIILLSHLETEIYYEIFSILRHRA